MLNHFDSSFYRYSLLDHLVPMTFRLLHALRKTRATLIAFLMLGAVSTSYAQMGGSAVSDDGLLGGLIPKTATQAPGGPAIVGGSSAADRAAILDRESVLRQTIITSNPDTKPADPSEFQKYVQEKTGVVVPYFGANFFSNNPSTFAPVQNIPVPSDYEFGPGDEVVIRAWGGINIDYRAVLDRNGFINIPAAGSVMLNGVKASQAEGIIRNQIGKSFSNFQIKVTPGQIRAIRIYVVGQAQKPGTVRGVSRSSIRTNQVPPCARASSQLPSAVVSDPKCRGPVGDGAKRPR